MLNHRTRCVPIAVLRDYMVRLLEAVGFDRETAGIVAGVHLESDLRGVGVQGLNHLVNSHLKKYRDGKADPRAKPEIVKEGPCHALIDGHSGPGPVAGLFAADVAIRKAKESGLAVVGVTNSHDMYQAGLYAERIARSDLVAMVYSDDVIPVVHPLGGVEPVIGSNPVAWAVPTEDEPFVLDFAPCRTLPTYVRYTERYGGALPEGVAHDLEGKPVTDPAKVYRGVGESAGKGAIDPGGNKGYGLLLVIDFLSGALVGADMGLAHVRKKGAKKGHLFIAIDPNLFGSIGPFKRAVGDRIDEIKGSRKAPGVEAIRVPGEGSHARRRANLRAGEVEIDALCWEDGLKLARELGVALPAMP
ncbi:MAG: Ldh family oxidoreductase [Alphaproteobacteria bacterium]